MTRRPLRLSLIGLVVLASTIALTTVSSTPANAGSAGWITICPPTHQAPGDPIVFRGSPARSPIGFRADGRPTRSVFYYRASNISSSYLASQPVESFPPDFRQIAGNGKAQSISDQPKLGAQCRLPSSSGCPSTHPRVLPRVIFRMEYPVGRTTGKITLSSGASYTVHADFWTTWEQSALDRLVTRCLRANTDCGNIPA